MDDAKNNSNLKPQISNVQDQPVSDAQPIQAIPNVQSVGSILKESGPISAPEISQELKDIGVSEISSPEAPETPVEKFKIDLPSIADDNPSQAANSVSAKIMSVETAKIFKGSVKDGVTWEAKEVVREDGKSKKGA